MTVRINNKRLSSMLNKRLEFWQRGKSDTMNELGQYPITDNLKYTLWGNITPQTGSLLNGRTADTCLTKTTHKITIRYNSDITSDMWVMFNNTRYNILYILDPYEDNERMEIFCEVVTP